MLDNIYFYIIPGILFLSFVYIIFLLITRQSDFQLIENNFEKSLNSLFKMTEKNFNIFANSLNNKAEQTLTQFINANEHQLKDITIQIKNLIEQLLQMQENQKKLNNINFELFQNISHLNNEIKKRDAIIERKIKQIKRLKNDI